MSTAILVREFRATNRSAMLLLDVNMVSQARWSWGIARGTASECNRMIRCLYQTTSSHPPFVDDINPQTVGGDPQGNAKRGRRQHQTLQFLIAQFRFFNGYVMRVRLPCRNIVKEIISQPPSSGCMDWKGNWTILWRNAALQKTSSLNLGIARFRLFGAFLR